MSERLNFKISSALKSVIGRDLITNDFVAIFELVKNSFDARATKVDIIFQTNADNLSKIFIADNGKGMSYQDLLNKWLFVGYSAKQDGTEDDSLQIYAGNKGVGRFSCDRLGAKLRLQSKAELDSEVQTLDVDWGSFEEDSKLLFEKVDVLHNVREEYDLPADILNLKNGVILEISELRDPGSWDRAKLLRLKRHLAKLINPFGDSKSKISVNLHCAREIKADQKEDLGTDESKQKIVNGPIQNLIFDTLKEKTTWLQVNMDNKGFLISTLVDRGELIYKIKEKAESYEELIDSDFNCEIFYLNMSAKQTFSKRMSISSPEFGSLLLFRNGFRVFPIGEPGDDYWRIDLRRQQGFARYLGTRDILGRVDIAGPESKFKESSSRDKGLVETKASRQLYDCVIKKCIRRLENYVVGVTWKDKLDKNYDTAQRLVLDENRSRIIDIVSSLAKSEEIELLDYSHNLIDVLSEKSNYFEGSIEKLSQLAEGVGDQALRDSIQHARDRFTELKFAEQEALKIADKEAQARKLAEKQVAIAELQKKEAESKVIKATQALEEEKKRNLFLVSSETRDKEQLESFLHQIVIFSSLNKQKIIKALKDIEEKNVISKDEITEVLSDLLETTEKIATTSRFATSANFVLDSNEIDDDICLYIKEYLEKICTAYQSRIKIIVNINSKPFVTRFTPIELGMVFDNIVNNAKKARASVITFDVTNSNKDILQIAIENNGRSLDKSIEDPVRIFEKGYTKTRGSGLGLYHAKNQIERMGGEIVLPNQLSEKGFKLIIRMIKA